MSISHNRKIQRTRSEGSPIGIDIDILDKPRKQDGKVDLILFEDIYWKPAKCPLK